MTALGVRLTLLAFTVWAACFWVLQRTGTWLPFAFAGVALSFLVVMSGAVPLSLLRPTRRALLVGTLGGAAMVVVTHAGYRLVGSMYPGVRSATGELMTLLYVVGYPDWARILLISTIACSEELIFRGLLPSWPGSASLAGILQTPRLPLLGILSLFHALATAPLASALLVGCALVCGIIWGALRFTTGSLAAPILAHVIWDLGVLLLWPLPTFAA